jgi:DNA-binding phage protein
MFGWLEFGILLLRLANAVIGELNKQGFINEGRRQIVAENLAEIARKTGVSKDVLAKMYSLDDAAVDDVLRGLEPK